MSISVDSSATVKQKSDQSMRVARASGGKRSAARSTLFINRSATVEEKGGKLNVGARTSGMKRSVANRTLFINRSTTIEEKGGNLNVVTRASDTKRSAAIRILFINRSATVEEKGGNLNAVLSTSDMKRSAAIRTLCVNRSATIDEKGGSLNLVRVACEVKGTPLTRRAGHTRIEVQPTPTHVTLECRTTEPVDVELPTLLTQRGGSERGHRHRKLHDTSSFEPADVVVVCQLSPADLQAHRPNIHLGQRILQQCLESGQSPALGLHLHRRFLFAPCCRDLHRDALCICL